MQAVQIEHHQIVCQMVQGWDIQVSEAVRMVHVWNDGHAGVMQKA